MAEVGTHIIIPDTPVQALIKTYEFHLNRSNMGVTVALSLLPSFVKLLQIKCNYFYMYTNIPVATYLSSAHVSMHISLIKFLQHHRCICYTV